MKQISILLLLTILLIACGGGSSTTTISDDNSSNRSPIAIAGVDKNISFGTALVLDAKRSSDSDGEIVSYVWREGTEILSSQADVILENLSEGRHLLLLTVRDDKGAIATDTIEIRTYSDTVVALETDYGVILLKMKSSIAPKAVENFVTHSKNAYYDGITFHRIVKGFMLQSGDPTGTGLGGESIWGEPFYNEIDPNINFDKPFLLAMANTDTPKRIKTNKSQFFITTTVNEVLNGRYTIFGEVLEGFDVIKQLESVETGSSGIPIKQQKLIQSSLFFELK